MDRRRLLHAAALALAGGLAGCGGDGDGNGTATPPAGGDTPSETATVDGTPSPTASPTDAGTATPDGAGGTATPSPTPAATPSSTPAATPSPTATPSSTPRSADQVVEVGPDGDQFAFVPDSFEVEVGATVRWVWRAGGHNVRVDAAPGGSDWSGTPGDAGDTYPAGYTHSHTFTTSGEYEYFCAPHRSLGMTGSFTVTE